MFKYCPGIRSIVSPKIIIRKCPFCEEEVEFLEYETQQECPNCGRIVYREPSEVCVTWCSYANKCINELEKKGMINLKRSNELRKIMKKSNKSTL